MTKRTGWLAAILGGAVLAAIGITVQAAQDPPPGQVAVAEIRLADRNGSCTVARNAAGNKLATELVEVSKANRPWVKFVVINNCSSQAEVRIANLRHRTAPSAPDPGDPTVGNRKEMVKAGGSSTTLRIKVRSNAVEGLWDYDVLVNGKKVDPGIKINP